MRLPVHDLAEDRAELGEGDMPVTGGHVLRGPVQITVPDGRQSGEKGPQGGGGDRRLRGCRDRFLIDCSKLIVFQPVLERIRSTVLTHGGPLR
ncbi:hypothetical protein GCM10018782_35140 [Streptomyces griseoaurantiacus]|nr:hypothetical protein GCM10018782_35140 [Streptomyces griseoaurantiacus]